MSLEPSQWELTNSEVDCGLVPRDVRGGPGQSVCVPDGLGYSYLLGTFGLHFV